MANTSELRTYQGVTIVTLLFSIYGNLDYYYHHKVSATPFTANFWMLFAYWVVLYVNQIFAVLLTFQQNEEILKTMADIGWHFPIFNIFVFIWSELFIDGHYIWSELFLILNLINVSYMYTKHKSYSIRPFTRFAIIHIPLAAMTFSWLLYGIFWNGAIMFHVKERLWGRLLANIFIWTFLGIGLLWMYWFNDCAVGFSLSYLVFSLMVGQLAIKAFALQWIFALVIASILFVLSCGVFIGILRETSSGSSESAPLLEEQA